MPVTGFGAEATRYTARTIGVPFTVTAAACCARNDGSEVASDARSACTDAGVGAAPSRIATRTRLFLSRNMTSRPVPVWAHPSGYFIRQPPAGSPNVRKTWLSGMSPLAALAASEPSAPTGSAVVAGAAAVVAAGAGAADVVAAGPVGPVENTVDDAPPPQAATSTASGGSTATARVSCMSAGSRAAPERHLTGRRADRPCPGAARDTAPVEPVILICEDDAELRRLVVRGLARRGVRR